MVRLGIVGAVLASVLAGCFVSVARADVATRCDWRGCSHIVCNWTGDRCHRFYGDGYYRHSYDRSGYDRYDHQDYDRDYDGRSYRYDDVYDRDDTDRGWRYDCDSDADNCYIERSHYWNY
ncbi:MAG TPA: hypothetical protein VLT91_11230 [Rhizomicrobium sp.]|nr:hypothetical protein [Rhizomicrobium sp.]